MSLPLPPHQLRIKRKKNEDPVDSIYIQTDHRQKRRRFTDFVFRRQVTSEEPRFQAASPAPSLFQDEKDASTTSRPVEPSRPSRSNQVERVKKRASTPHLRRFHLASTIASSRDGRESPVARLGNAGVQKRKKELALLNVPVLVERLRRSPAGSLLETTRNREAGSGDKQQKATVSESTVTEEKSEPDTASEIPRRKRPGATSRVAPKSASAAATGEEVVQDDMSQLASEMYEWAEQEHVLHGNNEAMDEKGDEVEDDSEGEYVYDTFYRHQNTNADGLEETKKDENAGIIVIDPQDREWDRYMEEEHEESELEEEDSDDENAEGWYGNDYPDDPWSSEEDKDSFILASDDSSHDRFVHSDGE